MNTLVSSLVLSALACIAAAGQPVVSAYYAGQYAGYPYGGYPGLLSSYYYNGMLPAPYTGNLVVYPDGVVAYPPAPAAAAVAVPATPTAAAVAVPAVPAAPAAAALAVPAAPAVPAATAIRYGYGLPAAFTYLKKK